MQILILNIWTNTLFEWSNKYLNNQHLRSGKTASRLAFTAEVDWGWWAVKLFVYHQCTPLNSFMWGNAGVRSETIYVLFFKMGLWTLIIFEDNNMKHYSKQGITPAKNRWQKPPQWPQCCGELFFGPVINVWKAFKFNFYILLLIDSSKAQVICLWGHEWKLRKHWKQNQGLADTNTREIYLH